MTVVKIIDFRARTDRVVYILSDRGMSYAVINNDPTLVEGAKVVEGRGRRDILFARLQKPWTNARELVEYLNFYQGLSYNHQMKVVRGSINPNDIGSYSTSDEEAVSLKSVPKVVTSLNGNVMDVLEDLLVPRNIANEMRDYIRRNLHKS